MLIVADEIQSWLIMVYHGWLPYQDKLCYNAILDHGWPCLTMVDFHIKTIFVTMWRLSMVNHDWPWMTMFNLINHGWPRLTMIVHDLPWLTMINILRKSLSLCDVGPWLTMINILRKFVSLCDVGPWLTMIDIINISE